MIDKLKNLLEGNDFDFVGWRNLATTFSVIMVVLSWVAFFVIGPNWGIDFTGGTEINIAFEDDVSVSELRTALKELGISDDAVQEVGSSEDHEFIVRIQDATFGSDEFREQVVTRLSAAFSEEWVGEPRFDAEVGARLTIDYTGEDVTPQQVAMHLTDIEGVVVQAGKDEKQMVVKLPSLSRQVEGKIHDAMGDKDFEVLAIDAVGPKVGSELRRQSFISIAATLGLVLLYVAFRFDIAFAPGAILALFHDVSITLGIFVLFQRELNLPIIGALLTIVGYSLNDTIVIYDRIRENMTRYRQSDLPRLINVSINETLARTLATSVTTMFAIAAFLVLGGPVIENFALAMMLGIVFGTYSTIYVASPTILAMQDVKPWLNKLVAGAQKATSREGKVELIPEVSANGTSEVTEPTVKLTQSEMRRRERARLEQGNDS